MENILYIISDLIIVDYYLWIKAMVDKFQKEQLEF